MNRKPSPQPPPKLTKDEEVRRASSFPVGHFGANHPSLDGVAAEPAEPSVPLDKARYLPAAFRRTDQDRAAPRRRVTQREFPSPPPARPMPGASQAEIAAYNEAMLAIPHELRLLHMAVPRRWLTIHNTPGLGASITSVV